MMYSVFNVGTGLFDYFEDSRALTSTNTPPPSHVSGRELGMTPEQAAWPLPADAKQVGQGEVAIGRVAVRKGAASGLGGILEGSSTATTLGLLVAAGLAWKYLVKGKR